MEADSYSKRTREEAGAEAKAEIEAAREETMGAMVDARRKKERAEDCVRGSDGTDRDGRVLP